MDLNQLLYQHQRALMNERQSAAQMDRKTYFDLVEYYAKRIREFRRTNGVGEHRPMARQEPLTGLTNNH